MTQPAIPLPNFHAEKMPTLRLKSIRFQNFKVFSDYTFNFCENDLAKQFLCFIGPNGTGKSTILSSARLLFGNFNEMAEDRLYYNLGRCVRHNNGYKDHSLTNDNFLITANLQSSIGDYEVQLDRTGFIKDHPEEIKPYLYRLCYYTRFDQELSNFQLARGKWGTFKRIFEAITGFTIKEQVSAFSLSDDPSQKKLMEDYVLGFLIKKSHETISHKECSDGEKKIIKSFSTLLNQEFAPQIIMTDNIEMHVESSRHLKLIREMKSCFPDSQLLTTTHSYHISKNFVDRNQIYDLRIIHAKPIIAEEPWRLHLIDEINDRFIKLDSVPSCGVLDIKEKIKNEGNKLLKECQNKKISNLENFRDRVVEFTSSVDSLYIRDLVK